MENSRSRGRGRPPQPQTYTLQQRAPRPPISGILSLDTGHTHNQKTKVQQVTDEYKKLYTDELKLVKNEDNQSQSNKTEQKNKPRMQFDTNKGKI